MSDGRTRELERKYRESGSEEDGKVWAMAVLRENSLPALATIRHLYRQQAALITIANLTRPQSGFESMTQPIMDALTMEPTPDEIVGYLQTGVFQWTPKMIDATSESEGSWDNSLTAHADEEGNVTVRDSQGDAVPSIPIHDLNIYAPGGAATREGHCPVCGSFPACEADCR